MAAFGFRINEHGGKYELRLGYYSNPKAAEDYDVETASVQKALADLKRSYTLKLFARGEEAQELFASLARELAAM